MFLPQPFALGVTDEEVLAGLPLLAVCWGPCRFGNEPDLLRIDDAPACAYLDVLAGCCRDDRPAFDP